jgi:hypothetical protein
MKKFFITLAVIMMIGLMATAAMAAQGADRNKPGGAAIIDYWQVGDNGVFTIGSIYNTLSSNWIRVHVAAYDSTSLELWDDTFDLSPNDTLLFQVDNGPSGTELKGTAQVRFSMGNSHNTTVVYQRSGTTGAVAGAWSTAANCIKQGYMTVVVTAVGKAQGSWAPLFSSSNGLGATELKPGVWGVPPDAIFATCFFINMLEAHGEGANALQIQGFENLPNLTKTNYNWANPSIRLNGKPADFNRVAGGNVFLGNVTGFTAANATTNPAIPGMTKSAPGLNTNMFVEYPDVNANSKFFGRPWGGFPKDSVAAPNTTVYYSDLVLPNDPGFLFPNVPTVNPNLLIPSGGGAGNLLPLLARVPGSKSLRYVTSVTVAGGVGTVNFTPIATTDYFDWNNDQNQNSAIISADDPKGANIDAAELYLTDGWGNVLILPSPAPVDQATTPLVPIPVLSTQAAQRWIYNPAISVFTDFVVCFPAGSNDVSRRQSPFKGLSRVINYWTYDEAEKTVSASNIPWPEVARGTVLPSGVNPPYSNSQSIGNGQASNTAGWLYINSSANAQGASLTNSLPFCGFAITYSLATTGQRFSSLLPLVDMNGSARIGGFGNATNILVSSGGGVANGIPGSPVAIANLNTEYDFGPVADSEADARGFIMFNSPFVNGGWQGGWTSPLMSGYWLAYLQRLIPGFVAGSYVDPNQKVNGSSIFSSNPPFQPSFNGGLVVGASGSGETPTPTNNR